MEYDKSILLWIVCLFGFANASLIIDDLIVASNVTGASLSSVLLTTEAFTCGTTVRLESTNMSTMANLSVLYRLEINDALSDEGTVPTSYDELLTSGVAIESSLLQLDQTGTTNFVLFVWTDGDDDDDATPTSTELFTITGFTTMVPLIFVILIAVCLKNVYVALFSGIWVGAFILSGLSFRYAYELCLGVYILDSCASVDHQFVILFTLFLGGLVFLIQRSGGTIGFSTAVSHVAKTVKSTQLACFISGFCIFFDDYANALVVGATFRPLTDMYSISREKLAFLVDATSAPVASLIPLSSWIGFELQQIQQQLDAIAEGNGGVMPDGLTDNAFVFFVNTIPTRFYPLYMLFFQFVLIVLALEFGPMLIAERYCRVQQRKDGGAGANLASGDQETGDAQHVGPAADTPTKWWNMALPLLALIVLILAVMINSGVESVRDDDSVSLTARNVFAASDSWSALLYGTFGASLFTMFLFFVQFKRKGEIVAPSFWTCKDYCCANDSTTAAESEDMDAEDETPRTADLNVAVAATNGDDDDEQKGQEMGETASALPRPGATLDGIEYDLDKDLQALRRKYPQFKPLLPRKMQAVGGSNASSSSIKCMQFNMCADGLSTSYTEEMSEKTFLNVDKACLQWPYRGVRLVEEMLRFDPDVIGIEECDQLPFLMKYLAPRGYASCFAEKKGSPIKHVAADIEKERKMDEGTLQLPNDGVALVYKQAKFELSAQDSVQIVDPTKNDKKIVGLGVPLRLKHIGQEVLFIVTHLKSTKSKEGEAFRREQINILLTDLIKNERSLPVVLLCDLNANPVSNKKGYDPLCYDALTDTQGNLGYQSVYVTATGKEPDYTTWKQRQHGTDKHVLDYIFLKGGSWKVTALLSIPESAADGDMAAFIPNWHYPSDHFSIVAELTWSDEKAKPLMGFTESVEVWIKGIAFMSPAISMLILVWAIGAIMVDIGADRYFTGIIGNDVEPESLPTLVFVAAALLSAATGTSWGTMTILFPLVSPAAWTLCSPLDNGVFLYTATMSQILSGSIFGDHASPLSDTTLLSSVATQCDLFKHVWTQMPYAVFVAVFSVVCGTAMIGTGVSVWVTLLVGVLAQTLCALIIGAPVLPRSGRYDPFTECYLCCAGRCRKRTSGQKDNGSKLMALKKKTIAFGREHEMDRDCLIGCLCRMGCTSMCRKCGIEFDKDNYSSLSTTQQIALTLVPDQSGHSGAVTPDASGNPTDMEIR